MSAFKRLLAIFGGGVIGVILLILGAREILQTKALQSRGKTCAGDVRKTEYRGRRFFYVTASFKTEDGQPVTLKKRVPQDTYDAAKASFRVPVTYLPDNPSVCRIGPTPKTDFVTIGTGVFFLGIAMVSARRPE